MLRKAHEDIVQAALSRPGVRHEYDALEDEFALLREMVHARQLTGKTQEDVAKAMGTTTSVVGRLETSGGKQKHSPTLTTLQKYAEALNCTLQIRLVSARRINTIFLYNIGGSDEFYVSISERVYLPFTTFFFIHIMIIKYP